MRRMPCNPQGLEAGEFWSRVCGRNKGVQGLEPRSVLDNQRSPSPPTSSSTLSSSLGGGGGGGGGSSETAGVAAVSDKPGPLKWPTSSDSDGDGTRRDEWASGLQTIPTAALELGLAAGGDNGGMGVDEWEGMLSGCAASPSQEKSFLQWIMADSDGLKQQQIFRQGPVDFDVNMTGGMGFGHVDSGFEFETIGGMGGGGSSVSPATAIGPPLAFGVPSGGGFPPMNSGISVKGPSFGNNLYQEFMEDKPLFFGPGLILNQHQQEAHALSLPPFSAHHESHQLQHLALHPQPNRHHSSIVEPTCQIPPKASFPDSAVPDFFLWQNQHQQQGFSQLNAAYSYHLQQRQMKPNVAAGDDSAAELMVQQRHQQQPLVDQLFKVAELIEAGNSVSARGILARLNQQLPSATGKPLFRSAFYFKEALYLLTNTPTPPPSSSPSTPLDVVLKLGTYKAFCEVSPVLQFTNFTCIQTLLEELNGSFYIHIIDFDIGVGGQWSSFMQELAQRRCSSPGAATGTPFLKITALASTCSHHPLELHLTRENLSHFASDLSIPFEFNVVSLDPFDPSVLLNMCAGVDEAIAVNLPAGSTYHPSLLRVVKQLSPKIVVSVDHGCDRRELPFSHQFLHAFQSSAVLLDSIDAMGTHPDVANKIERFLLQPRIETALLGRHCAADKVLPWRTLFASAGFVPLQFSNFTETQAECLLKRVQVRGFHVENRQASLFLFWQHGELVSVSAWRC